MAANGGVVDAAAGVSDKLITSLPAQFLVLVLLNTCFIGGLLWFLDREQASRIALEEAQVASREHVLMPLLTACIQEGLAPQAPHQGASAGSEK
jgi:hypothetical protein